MIRLIGLVVTALFGVASAQQAELEFSGILGECTPVYAAAQDGLTLFRTPDVTSEQIEIAYQTGWHIPAPRHQGLTRVLSAGLLRVIEPDDRMHCSVRPTEGPATLVVGETVEYLYYRGEGIGEIRFRGAECQADIDRDSGHFESIKAPDIQVWLRVFFFDGTSPGWLLHDGSQTRVVRLLC